MTTFPDTLPDDKESARGFEIEFTWIPKRFGGFNRPPTPGLRPGIRWQGHIRESLEYHRSVILASVEYDAKTQMGSAILVPLSPDIPEHWMLVGAPIELLDGCGVIAVGVIKQTPLAVQRPFGKS